MLAFFYHFFKQNLGFPSCFAFDIECAEACGINDSFLQEFIHVAHDWQLGFQTPATNVMEGIIYFHDDLFVFLILILFFVFYVFGVCITLFSEENMKGISFKLVHASTLEIIWTIIPAVILIIIAIPSFSLLYSIDEIIEPLYTIKVIGHQWYWSYELVESEGFIQILNELSSNDNIEFTSIASEAFDSYMVPASESENHSLYYQYLTVDNHLFIPTEVSSRILVSSADVLHSWAVPSLGVKIDACPGRLNQTSLFIKRQGLYYGQCSEICGVNHGFMPIVVNAVSVNSFIGWVTVAAEGSLDTLFDVPELA